uniref:Uncharacterized protein n=1 Tax=Oncorhynchus tshawytscha TaxID=74940 RepID=A0AAZ3S9B1_ONCTS
MASQRRQMMQSHQSWTDDLPLCQMCGVGTAPNCTYGPDGKDTQSHPNEDGHFRFRFRLSQLKCTYDKKYRPLHAL